MKIFRLLALPALVLAGLACSSSPPSVTSHGTVTLEAGIMSGDSVTLAYPDVTSGSQVVVTDPAGTVIGTGTLTYDAAATLADATSLAKVLGLAAAADLVAKDVSVFSFTVTVPGGETRYGIAVGHGRGTVWESPAQMKAGPALSVGSLTG